ncbi:DUF3068 domain-containing protein [Nocardioides terrisoli]|uniref:DUF3068 domain-containing protein n=1 Tax=Nocardioides terrisoli TaxID=3388267 RepID=UPI00287B8735|nr:DUF3068 domain-containing protein [Nocardioides marmorisolisilvae]
MSSIAMSHSEAEDGHSRRRITASAGSAGGASPWLAVVAAVGAFLLVAGMLVHFYATPALAVAPSDQSSVTSLSAAGATVFDTNSLKDVTTDLSIKARTVGDVAASQKAPGDAVVWVSSTSIRDGQGQVLSRSMKRAAFDERTGSAVNCCGSFMQTAQGARTSVVRHGLVFKFPFFAKKQTYPFWDDTLGKAVDAKYVGIGSVQGLSVYRYVADVPASQVGTRDVPRSVLGLHGSSNIAADSNYQNHTTYYVEPVTGAIINQVSDTKSWLSAAGHDLVTTQAHIGYTPTQVTSMVKDIKGKASMLSLADGVVPWLLSLVGLAMMGAAILLGRRRRVV